MIQDLFDKIQFPPLPPLSVTGAPLYLEPIMGSGERLCIACAARGADDTWQVAPILDEAKARCLVGDQAASLLGFMRLGLESLSRHLAENGAWETWRAPVSGMMLGTISEGRADNLLQMLRMVAGNHAFLASMADFGAETEMTHRDTDDTDPWPAQVREAVIARHPPLSGWFGRRVRMVSQGAETRFDYLGPHLAAQLGRLIPGPGISGQVRTAKAKLWDLEALRDGAADLLRPSAYELLLYHPRDDDPAHSRHAIERLHEALSDLEAAGDRQQLRVRPVHTAAEAAEHIALAEAA